MRSIGEIQAPTVVDRSLTNIADSSSLNNVAHDELLDGLVLRAGSPTVGATNSPNVASALLVPSVIATLHWHFFESLLNFLIP